MQTLRTPSGTYTLAPTRDSGAFVALLAKCTGKHKRSAIKADARAYPKFAPGDSTKEYVRAFEMLNGARNLAPGFYDLEALNCEPCILYTGEDTHETIADDAPSSREAPQALETAAPVPMVQDAAPDAPALDSVAMPTHPAPVPTIGAVFQRLANETPLHYLPLFVRLAIERADADSDLRTSAKVCELISAYGKTYGQTADASEIASALHICRRRFWNFDAAANDQIGRAHV